MSRLLIVCRHFWPVSNATAYRMAELVRYLRRQSFEAQVLTTRWHSSWPIQSAFHEVPLTRILPASTSAWNEGHFQRNLWSWAERNCNSFDVCYVDSLELVANSKLSSNLKDKTYLLRVDLNNARDREILKRPSSTLQALASSARTRFMVHCASDHRTVIGAGIASSRVVRIEPIVGYLQRTAASQEAAKMILGTLGIDFLIPERLPLVLLMFDGDDYNAENAYIKMLKEALEKRTPFRGWIFGANDSLRRHYAYLKDVGLHHDILLHSAMDDLNTLYDAADFVMAPNIRDAKAFYYPQAVARGVATPFTQVLEAKTSERSVNVPLGELINSIDPETQGIETPFQDFLANTKMYESTAIRLQQRVQWQAIDKYNGGVWRDLLPSA